MADEEDPKKPTEEEKPAFNVIGPVVCFVVFLIILIVGGVLNANAKDKETSKVEETAPSLADYAFNRVANAPICLQLDAACDVDTETVAEIVKATDDGMMVVYTDSEQENIGMFDISDPSDPKPAGTVPVGGEPTSLIVKGKYVVAGINTSEDYINVSGALKVVDMDTKEIVATIDMGGQPDAVAISPDKTFIAVAIENERDEDLGDGIPPQLPGGYVQIVDSSAEDPSEWTATLVNMTGLEGVNFPLDPEPEFVDINADNIVVVTLQENNAIVLIDCATAEVTKSFSAGTVSLETIDTEEEGIIDASFSLADVPREPDGVTWIGVDYFATANEGDMDGGSRGFSIWDIEGNVVYDSGNEMDLYTMRVGHYPEERSGNKGNEPENVIYSEFGDFKLLFVGSERANLVFVYDVADVTAPVLKQVLPTGVGPEGKVAIPSRNLVVVAAEKDDRGDKFRSALGIYELQEGSAVYPTIISADGDNDLPIPFSALSGLGYMDGILYSVEDSFYKESRMFVIDPSTYSPATITAAVKIMDSNDVLSSVLADATKIPEVMIGARTIVNDDKTVNVDLEGIAPVEGGFWLCSEGRGTFDDADRPLEMPNLLLMVDTEGVIMKAVTLPLEVGNIQLRFGFEGVTVYGDYVVVAFQRVWNGEDGVRIGLYNTVDETWSFVFYGLDTPTRGWVGLSDITSIGDGKFYVLERDNQGGFDSTIKKVYEIDLGDLSGAAAVPSTVVEKTLVVDLVPEIMAFNGALLEKVEGMAVDSDGNLWINNDNDGVDDNSGEQLLIKIEL